MAKISLLFASSNILFSYYILETRYLFFWLRILSFLLITVMVAMFCLDRDFNELEYQTFMLQPHLIKEFSCAYMVSHLLTNDLGCGLFRSFGKSGFLHYEQDVPESISPTCLSSG